MTYPYDATTGGRVKSDGTIINIGDALKQIISGFNANVVMDSFRAAVVNGLAYKMGFADPTGIPAATSYYYWVKNTSLTKSIWLRPLSFASGTFLVRIVKGGIFQVGGVTYNPDDYINMSYTGTLTASSPYISGTFDTSKIKVGMYISGIGIPARTVVGAVTSVQITMSNVATVSGTGITLTISLPSMVSRNLNANFTNPSAMQIWYQNVLGAITYVDSAIDQVYNVTDYSMNATDPAESENEMNILPPGAEFMVIFTNYGTVKIPYSLTAKWAEI